VAQGEGPEFKPQKHKKKIKKERKEKEFHFVPGVAPWSGVGQYVGGPRFHTQHHKIEIGLVLFRDSVWCAGWELMVFWLQSPMC
jgi:hypothetical protein